MDRPLSWNHNATRENCHLCSFRKHQAPLIYFSRDFSIPVIPWVIRIGNVWTSRAPSISCIVVTGPITWAGSVKWAAILLGSDVRGRREPRDSPENKRRNFSFNEDDVIIAILVFSVTQLSSIAMIGKSYPRIKLTILQNLEYNGYSISGMRSDRFVNLSSLLAFLHYVTLGEVEAATATRPSSPHCSSPSLSRDKKT